MAQSNTIAEQLAAYRIKKAKEHQSNESKNRIWTKLYNMVDVRPRTAKKEANPSSLDDSENSSSNCENEIKNRTLIKRTSSMSNENASESDQGRGSSSFQTQSGWTFENYSKLDWGIVTLQVFLWLSVWKIAIIYEWGAVFFLLSAFVFIWYNMKESPKKDGELSAYSVFNPNCEQIEGTFTAEQFERELLHKM